MRIPFTYRGDIHNDYQMAVGLCHAPTIQATEYAWEQEFYDRMCKVSKIDYPKPIIYQRKLYFSGGFELPGRKPDGDHIIIADFQLRHIRVPVRETRLPTDKEYTKHFKRIVDLGAYQIEPYGEYVQLVKRRVNRILTTVR